MTKYNVTTLKNGLRVIHLPSTSPVVYCGIGIPAGSRHETVGEEGLAHFCEHTTFKGTRRRSALQILNCLESVGGDLNAFTNKEDTVFYAAIQREHFSRAVDLLTDIVFNSQYPQHEIVHEADVICDEIESYNDSPAELICDEFENMLFQGHPLGHNILGTRERLRTYTSADALRFARRHYRPDNAVFFVYGDVPFERLVLSVERGVLSVESGERSDFGKEEISLNPPLSTLHPHHQAHVMLGTQTFAANDGRRIPLFLLNNILGGPGMNARLNLALRERRGLVYTVESNMTTYSDTGVWCVYFGCDHKDVKRCLNLVQKELDHLAVRLLSDRQLAAAKKQLKGQLAIASDNHEQFALDFARICLHEHREHHIGHLFRQIDAVSADQLQQIASEFFNPDRLQTLIL